MSEEIHYFPSAESASGIEDRDDAIGAELMYVHNTFVAVLNDLIGKHNAKVDAGESIEDRESIAQVGAANAYSFAISFLQERIKGYIKNFDSTIGEADTTISASEAE
jgi:hypothetical protein